MEGIEYIWIGGGEEIMVRNVNNIYWMVSTVCSSIIDNRYRASHRDRGLPPKTLTCVFDLSVLVLLAQAVLEDRIDLVRGEGLAQRQQSVGQLSGQHGAVLVLVVQLQALDEVLVASLLLLGLHLAVDRQEFLQRQQLLVALLGLADLLDQGQRRVAVQRAQHITQVEGVDLLRAIGIVDAERELGLCGGRKRKQRGQVSEALLCGLN